MADSEFTQPPADAAGAPTDGSAATPPADESAKTSLRSVHTTTVPRILDHVSASVAVTTYQAGKLVLLRSEPRTADAGGSVLNTHFRAFNKPMGFAWEPGRFALGTHSEIREFHDMPAVARKLDVPESLAHHDAAFLPRLAHVTGDVQVHEMVWVPQPRDARPSKTDGSRLSELWFVNTRFSCLATRSDLYSFVPRWKPPFITSLGPDDRCHLNGLALRDGRPRYVTALGDTDTAGGWRQNKRAGGVVIDLNTDETIVRGLSMPHSPRWHNGRLWVLESGNGGVGFIDEKTGEYEDIVRLPGFTRGLDFAGPYAFVGLSQVRETSIFSGIAIAEMKQEDRCCGVWVIDTRNGQIAGFVKFVEGVQEIFAVQVLPGMRWPEVLSEDPKRISESYELPDEALKLVPEKLRQPASAPGGSKS